MEVSLVTWLDFLTKAHKKGNLISNNFMFCYNVEMNIGIVAFESELLYSFWIFWDEVQIWPAKIFILSYLFCSSKLFITKKNTV